MLNSVAVVMRGTVLAQIVGFLVLPILTRNFSPAAFGQFQVFQSFLAIALVAATLRYEIAILRAETPRELGAVLVLCFCINTSLTVLAIGLYASFDAPGSEENFAFALIIPGFLFGGAVQYLGYLAIRERLFSITSNGKVAQALSNAATALALALSHPISSGIIIADVVGRVGGAAMLAISLRHLHAAITRPTKADVLAAAKKFREYPLISLPGGIVNMAGAMLTPIMIFYTFDAATSGQFGLLERTAALPLGLIGASISQVYMAQLANDLRTGEREIFQRFTRLIKLLAVVSIPSAIIIGVLAPPLFALVFGAGWEEAASFAQVMMPAYAVMLVASATNMTLIVVGWQRTQFMWEVARLAAMTALWAGGAQSGWSAYAMVAGHSILLGLFALVMIGLSARAVHVAMAKAVNASDASDAVAAARVS